MDMTARRPRGISTEPGTTSAPAAGLGLLGAGCTATLGVALGRAAVLDWRALLRAEPAALLPVATGVEMLAAAVGALAAGWLTLLLLAGVGHVTPGPLDHPLRRLALWLSPQWAPRVGALLLAVSLGTPNAAALPPVPSPAPVHVSASVLPASSTAWSSDPDAGPTTDDDAPVPGWRPTGPPPGPPRGQVELVSRGTAPTDSVIVRSGDTLWSIAASHLGPDATVAEIAAQWPRWFDANREVIGNDPDLILPGQQLRPPAHQNSALGSGVRP
ncbi:hypothetical protein BH24ACT8_BH24ACT8_10330 [soil metagenome]